MYLINDITPVECLGELRIVRRWWELSLIPAKGIG